MTFLGLDKRDLRLTFNLFKMMLRDRYLGSALGGAWAILNPLMLLGLYTFVFGFVFRSKLPGVDSTFAYSHGWH
jgi:lipopolysaccharide transport system permease protein